MAHIRADGFEATTYSVGLRVRLPVYPCPVMLAISQGYIIFDEHRTLAPNTSTSFHLNLSHDQSQFANRVSTRIVMFIRISTSQIPSCICRLKEAPYALRPTPSLCCGIYTRLFALLQQTLVLYFSLRYARVQWSQGCLRPMSAWPSW
jgi:hypothetical protein